jgi:hypothetical protein
MKQILMALTIVGFTYFSAEAQNDGKTCEKIQSQVCRKGGDCYKTKYAENFKVCKNENGYFICCETPDHSNSTHPGFVAAKEADQYYSVPANDVRNYDMAVAVTDYGNLPESQSYSGYKIVGVGKDGTYYLQKGKMKSCYTGNNVAELNKAPYEGCPSPQYDGLDKNKERNLNVVTDN